MVSNKYMHRTLTLHWPGIPGGYDLTPLKLWQKLFEALELGRTSKLGLDAARTLRITCGVLGLHLKGLIWTYLTKSRQSA